MNSKALVHTNSQGNLINPTSLSRVAFAAFVRITGRTPIYRKRVNKRLYGVTQLKLFTRIDIGKRCLYISKSRTPFWSMEGIVSNGERDYVIHSA